MQTPFRTHATQLGRQVLSIGTALLLACALPAHADDVQDAHKLFKQGRYAQALDKIDGFLGAQPKDAQGRFLKGLILTEQGKTADAIKLFTGLTEDYPELPEPYNNLAVLYAGNGQYDKARQSLEMAIRTHPSYATAHENLGDIYAKMASQAYDRALQLDRSNAATKTKLAMIQDLFAGKTHASRPVASPVKETPAPVVVAAAETPAPVAVTAQVKPVAAAPAVKPVEPAKPVAATAAEPAKPAKPAGNPRADINKAVLAWAAAWSGQDVPAYLSHYAANFDTGNMSRADWEAQRQDRLTKPKSIQVKLSRVKITLQDENHARVQFRQAYRASHMRANGDKTLQMVKTGGRWLIEEESAK